MNKEYYFKEGCYIQEWQNSAGDESMSIARVRVAAQTKTKNHALKNTVERYVILSGQAEVTVDGSSRLVNQGSVVTIGANQPQCIHNTGQEDLIFLAICTPRFLERNYQDLEPEQPHQG